MDRHATIVVVEHGHELEPGAERIRGTGEASTRAPHPAYLDGIERHFTLHLIAEDRRRIESLIAPVVDAHQAELDLRR
jgi:hypothetical protein